MVCANTRKVSDPMSDPFPLNDWFDITKRISKEDADLTEAQMALHAVKTNVDPGGPEAKRAYREMRAAVKAHNAKLNR